MRVQVRLLSCLTGLIVATSVSGQSVLTIGQVRDRALQQNRTYLQAQENITKAKSEVTTARSAVLPDLTFSGRYNRNFRLPSFYVQADTQTIKFTTGFKNEFGAGLSLEQNLFDYRAFQALSIAKLYKQYTQAQIDQVAAAVVYTADQLFFGVILRESQLEVVRKELEAASLNLENVEKKFRQGVVSEFEVLRARVEKANIEPALLRAESAVRIERKQLNSFLVYDLSEEFVLEADRDDTSLVRLPSIQSLKESALAQRPEMQEAEYLTQITQKAIGVARSGHFPTLSAVSDLNWQSQSDEFSLQENEFTSWSAGLRLSIPIFDGFATSGQVANSKADHRQQRLAERDMRDKIMLEVEQSYDQLLQAKKALDIQGVTIAQAEKGLRIANVRYESGVGTLLEVLSAQAALTEARNALAEALYFFRDARAQLKKSTTIDITVD